jgi:hypothetical protein
MPTADVSKWTVAEHMQKLLQLAIDPRKIAALPQEAK